MMTKTQFPGERRHRDYNHFFVKASDFVLENVLGPKRRFIVPKQ